MLETTTAAEFQERYRHLSKAVKRKAESKFALFRQNPLHPSLHTEKLLPKNREVWSFRLDRRYRVLFRFLNGGKVLLLTVGPHDWIYKIGLR